MMWGYILGVTKPKDNAKDNGKYSSLMVYILVLFWNNGNYDIVKVSEP